MRATVATLALLTFALAAAPAPAAPRLAGWTIFAGDRTASRAVDVRAPVKASDVAAAIDSHGALAGVVLVGPERDGSRPLLAVMGRGDADPAIVASDDVLPAGRYTATLLADGSATIVTLRVHGLSDGQWIEPRSRSDARLVAFSAKDGPPGSASFAAEGALRGKGLSAAAFSLGGSDQALGLGELCFGDGGAPQYLPGCSGAERTGTPALTVGSERRGTAGVMSGLAPGRYGWTAGTAGAGDPQGSGFAVFLSY